MKRKDIQTVGEFLSDFLKESDLGGQIKESKVIAAWGELLGESIVRYTTRLYIKEKVLYVHLSSSVLRNELYMCRSMLLERLNRAAGGGVINQIIFR